MPMDLQGIYETSQKTCSQAVAKYKKDPEDAENRPYLLINKTSVIFSNISFCKVLKVAASNGGHKVSMSCIDEGEPGKYKVTSVYKLQNSVLQDQGNGKTFSYAKCASFN